MSSTSAQLKLCLCALFLVLYGDRISKAIALALLILIDAFIQFCFLVWLLHPKWVLFLSLSVLWYNIKSTPSYTFVYKHIVAKLVALHCSLVSPSLPPTTDTVFRFVSISSSPMERPQSSDCKGKDKVRYAPSLFFSEDDEEAKFPPNACEAPVYSPIFGKYVPWFIARLSEEKQLWIVEKWGDTHTMPKVSVYSPTDVLEQEVDLLCDRFAAMHLGASAQSSAIDQCLDEHTSLSMPVAAYDAVTMETGDSTIVRANVTDSSPVMAITTSPDCSMDVDELSFGDSPFAVLMDVDSVSFGPSPFAILLAEGMEYAPVRMTVVGDSTVMNAPQQYEQTSVVHLLPSESLQGVESAPMGTGVGMMDVSSFDDLPAMAASTPAVESSHLGWPLGWGDSSDVPSTPVVERFAVGSNTSTMFVDEGVVEEEEDTLAVRSTQLSNDGEPSGESNDNNSSDMDDSSDDSMEGEESTTGESTDNNSSDDDDSSDDEEPTTGESTADDNSSDDGQYTGEPSMGESSGNNSSDMDASMDDEEPLMGEPTDNNSLVGQGVPSDASSVVSSATADIPIVDGGDSSSQYDDESSDGESLEILLAS
ncbi:hypothetical protein BDA99DRAFT_553988 [Phascolomyces articulosus]|uniref:Uncharacterized protein n=1 Tax=Phascolomyces articulosus TaxID=60185 RepID=A0AAD5PJ61_9FUNG|nr:hypothetical protein BDA99DRAFT_553988 [Phascolomyces articulosus]